MKFQVQANAPAAQWSVFDFMSVLSETTRDAYEALSKSEDPLKKLWFMHLLAHDFQTFMMKLAKPSSCEARLVLKGLTDEVTWTFSEYASDGSCTVELKDPKCSSPRLQLIFNSRGAMLLDFFVEDTEAEPAPFADPESYQDFIMELKALHVQ